MMPTTYAYREWPVLAKDQHVANSCSDVFKKNCAEGQRGGSMHPPYLHFMRVLRGAYKIDNRAYSGLPKNVCTHDIGDILNRVRGGSAQVVRG